MRKFIILVVLLTLTACVVGEMKPERKRLYEMGNDICERDPSKCIHGVPW